MKQAILGWVRDAKGHILNRPIKTDHCNAVTTFCGGGTTQIKDTEWLHYSLCNTDIQGMRNQFLMEDPDGTARTLMTITGGGYCLQNMFSKKFYKPGVLEIYKL